MLLFRFDIVFSSVKNVERKGCDVLKETYMVSCLPPIQMLSTGALDVRIPIFVS